jgi:hypothetical protein
MTSTLAVVRVWVGWILFMLMLVALGAIALPAHACHPPVVHMSDAWCYSVSPDVPLGLSP